jgi:hypothetical protein
VEARWDRPAPPPGRPPPLGPIKVATSYPVFTHTTAQKTTPSSLCGATLRERKLRKRVEKKSKGSQALNFSLAPLKVLDTMLGRILRFDNPPRRILYYRLNQSTLVIKR